MQCPACGAENLPGADNCDDCGFDLTAVSPSVSGTELIAEALSSTALTELESRKPVFAVSGESVDECVRKMQDANVGSLLVTDSDGELIGIVTERDLIMKVVPSDDGSAGDVTVDSIMTPKPHTLRGEDHVAQLLHNMAVYGYRRVPVQLQEGYTMVTTQQLFNYLLDLEITSS